MTEIAKMYGGSLYDLAAEEGLEARLLQDVEEAARILTASPEYLRLLSTPSIPKRERCDLLDKAFRGQIHLYVLNFLKILCENGTIRQFSGCAQEFRRRYNEDNGILEVRAVTAIPMNDALTQKLKDRLTAVTGKRIELSCQVDPACLGGVRLEMDGQQLDGTVQTRLDNIRRQLAQTVL